MPLSIFIHWIRMTVSQRRLPVHPVRLPRPRGGGALRHFRSRVSGGMGQQGGTCRLQTERETNGHRSWTHASGVLC